jgi:tight adherence protein C
MGFVIFAFLVIFLLIASGGFLLFYRQAMPQRLAHVIAPRQEGTGGLRHALQRTGSSFGGMVEQFERVMPKSAQEASIVQQRLIRAGYRNESAPKLLYGAKVLVPLALSAIVFLSGAGSFIFYASALGLGFLAPDFWLGRRIKERQKRIRLGLPDALDLLVICIEAGLSLDQATMRTADEMRRAQPAMCDELSVVVLEQRAGRPRADAWRNMAERTAMPSVRNLVSVLVQSEQFGTSIAKTLRIHSDTLRTQRRQQVEEQAAKTTVKIIFPLVLFIFPSLFVVVLGPAAITMAEAFQKYFK